MRIQYGQILTLVALCVAAKGSSIEDALVNIAKVNLYSILFVTSKHQTTNLVFPKFFQEIFSAWADEKENKLFTGPKQVFT